MLFPTLPNNAMTEPENKSDSMPSSPPPQPEVRRSRQVRISWIWLVPLVAAIVGASLLFRDWMHAGPTVTIAFDSADGLEVGQTKVRYKEVVVGTVTGIKVSPDRRKALVSAQIDRESANYIAQPGSRFWVVRPRLGISGVTGLNTLLSGAYISVDTAEKPASDADAVYEFEGLEKPPEISSSRPGTRFVLQAADLGSLEIGSPVYFRRIQVGQVVGYSLDSSGKSVNVQVFVDAPYDKFVTSDARFWNASGINLSLDADGLSVQTGSLVSMVAGGVAFASPNESDTEPAKANSVFQLAGSREQAMADPDGPPFLVEMHFLQSVGRRGGGFPWAGTGHGIQYRSEIRYRRAALLRPGQSPAVSAALWRAVRAGRAGGQGRRERGQPFACTHDPAWAARAGPAGESAYRPAVCRAGLFPFRGESHGGCQQIARRAADDCRQL
jgi:paraquat-inducible protein B